MRNFIVLPTSQLPDNTPDVYEIIVEGALDDSWSDWFEGVIVTALENDDTLLTARIPDQAALHGLLMRIRDLNLKLISVSSTKKRRPLC